MNEYTLKDIARMKKEFIESEFGKFAAQKITEMHGGFHEKAEGAASTEAKATFVDKAAGVNEVIRFFTSDVTLFDQDYFEEKKGAEPDKA